MPNFLSLWHAGYFELLKPRIVGMVFTTCSMGALLAGGHEAWIASLPVLLGVVLLTGGTCVLNQCLEHQWDALMERTRGRPIPSGRISVKKAVLFGAFVTLTGEGFLLVFGNLATAGLGVLAAGIYLAIYTPLKRISWLCTPVGAIAGAIPPLIGWTAVSPRLQAPGWMLFAVLWSWQHVHFYAIAWKYRDDYHRGGFRIFPLPRQIGLFKQMFWSAAALVGLSALNIAFGWSGLLFAWGGLACGAGVMLTTIVFQRAPSKVSAHRVMLATIFYLPLLFGMIIGDLI